MKSFRRVLHLAAQRRLSMLGIVVTSLIIAAMWGGNISILYPMTEVVFEGDDLGAYVHTQIGTTEKDLQEINTKLADADLPAVERSELEFRHKAVTYSLSWLRWCEPLVTRYAPPGPFNTLLLVVGFLLVCTAIKLVALTINMMLVQYIAEGTVMELREKFFRKALSLDLDHFGENGSANLTSRLTNDVAHVGVGLSTLIGRLIREPLKMIVCVGAAFIVCPRLLLLVMVVTPVVAFVTQRLSRAIRRASRRVMEEMSGLYGMLNDAFNGIRVVKSFNTQSRERARFRTHADAYFRRSMKVAFYNTFARGTSEMLGLTTVGLAILAGGYLAINQETHLLGLRMSDKPLDDSQVLLFFAFLIGASDPARKLTDVWSALQRGIVASARIYEIIDAPVRVTEPANAIKPPRPHNDVRFENVHFQYPSGPMVLQGIDLNISHGETVALVGPNGCGKSTLISLLCRFDDPNEGQICLDDCPINQMATRDLRRRIALVSQRTVLFDDTIENNIRYGSPSADSHDVVRAAKLAFADDFILRKTPKGYQTYLGSGGVRLSGGQMQRIALARAFLRNPDILILDEATSQIDIESEMLIHRALETFLKGRTGIMVTHRASTLALADRVAVLDQGKIASVGNHEKLMVENSFYRNLYGSEIADAA
ncbi:ATP-binding cassette subfamily B protein/subfamily B ATP-binding cassette protein MsbA [Rhodopirellula rubra]|uniref:ATP-binding cassette subfamily B protein/subfamily B ATP-binding cassette protein MsbA n=1 Tax=Aporhodopirellula rubra TaxID=980271 RepID=A0A7W5DV69_9BACT|nr:ABC transporter ATP-binding protein [Aporhodopirellula rubra]MBB3205156.1 ATP-binding cassette subfamily B protein/subfamily B ATP-binding cassette protein MsbA [Aporhodopirellula rubra]